MQTPRRVGAALALGAYVLALAVVLLQPSAGAAITTVGGVADWIRGFGFSREAVSNDRVEFVLNTVMVAPVAFLGSWLLPRLGVRDWWFYAFVASSLVEAVQGLFLADRHAQVVDIVGNSLGAALGALAALTATAWRRGQRGLSDRTDVDSGAAG